MKTQSRALRALTTELLVAEDLEATAESILGTLEQAQLIQPARGRTFSGTSKTDIYLGGSQGNVVDTKGGNDIVLGKGGNDSVLLRQGNDLAFGGDGNDTIFGGGGRDTIFGGAGDDLLDGGAGDDWLNGGLGSDTLLGKGGNDTLVGGDGVDTMTGGLGRDRFLYLGNPFATPDPDIITDYEIGTDQFALKGRDLGMTTLAFQKGNAAEITADGNALVLLDAFDSAGDAAKAIAANGNITAKEGVFVYHNLTQGISRLVYSKDLAGGGDFTVLANLTNQAGQTGIANLASFSASDFSLI